MSYCPGFKEKRLGGLKNWWSVFAAALMLIGTWSLLEAYSYEEVRLERRAFAQFPLVLNGSWTGREFPLEEEILDVLKVSDYMNRRFINWQTGGEAPDQSAGSPLPVWIYVGYYQSQRTGATYHSPKNCLPGAGWQFLDSKIVTINVLPEKTITINQAIIQKGLHRQLVMYWYHDRNRVIASEYLAKFFLIWDAVTKNRSDGALVRISIPFTTTEDHAYQTGFSFLQEFWPVLLDYMPSEKERLTT